MLIRFCAEAKDAGRRLGPFLRGQGVSASLLRQLKYQPGGLLVDGLRQKTSYLLQSGQEVTLGLAEDAPPLAQPQDIPLEIVYKSAHALVVDKPAGLVMHPVRSHKAGTLANAFAQLVKGGPQVAFRPVGRLDADTSGLVLCAMNAYAAPLLSQSVTKEYLALAEGRMAGCGAIDAPLGPAPGSAVEQRVQEGGKASLTHYKTLCSGEGWSLLLVRPQTGRTHQIRVHLAHVGHPLLGDGLYGGKQSFLKRHALHCAALAFTEPGAGRVRLCVPLPADMWAFLQAAGGGAIGKNPLTCQTFNTIV